MLTSCVYSLWAILAIVNLGISNSTFVRASIDFQATGINTVAMARDLFSEKLDWLFEFWVNEFWENEQ